MVDHYPKAWKTANRVMLPRLNKCDYMTIKSYQVISLLNCLEKV